MFGQMYDNMNTANLHIVYSPIFGQVPLHPNLANALANALGVAPDGLDDALNNVFAPANALANALGVAPDGLDDALNNVFALGNDLGIDHDELNRDLNNVIPANARNNFSFNINNNDFVVQNGGGLNDTDIRYFQKQTIKYIMTHNMLKHHYKDIDN